MDNINFSIIIPLYNKEPCIENTITSVLNQDYIYFEIVVVDDGSTDNSAEIVRSLKDSRIRLLQIDNGGVSHARNYGVRYSVYDWLIFLDGDDVILPTALTSFVKLMRKFPNEMVYCGNYTNKEQKLYGGFNSKKMRLYENPILAMWNYRFGLRPGSCVCHKSVFLKLGGYDERMSYYEDQEFYLRLAIQYRVASTPETVMEYLMENNQGRYSLPPIDAEFAYYLDKWNLSNVWLKSLLYRIAYGSYLRRVNASDDVGALYYKTLINVKFGKYYYYLNIFRRLRVRLFRYGI